MTEIIRRLYCVTFFMIWVVAWIVLWNLGLTDWFRSIAIAGAIACAELVMAMTIVLALSDALGRAIDSRLNKRF